MISLCNSFSQQNKVHYLVILHIKLDLDKQRFIHAAHNNFKVSHNFKANQAKQTVLIPICTLNCEKTLLFLCGIQSVSASITECACLQLVESEGICMYPLHGAGHQEQPLQRRVQDPLFRRPWQGADLRQGHQAEHAAQAVLGAGPG